MAGDEQGGDLHPDVSLFCDVEDGVEDRLEAGLAEAFVVFFSEGFEIDVDSVEPFFGEVDGFYGHEAVADEDVCEAFGFCESAAVGGELHKDGRFGVRVGDAFAAGSEGGFYDLLWSDGLAVDGA